MAPSCSFVYTELQVAKTLCFMRSGACCTAVEHAVSGSLPTCFCCKVSCLYVVVIGAGTSLLPLLNVCSSMAASGCGLPWCSAFIHAMVL